MYSACDSGHALSTRTGHHETYPGKIVGTLRKIVDFHLDENLDWVAELECGHRQYVRHDPPFSRAHWVTTAQGRLEHLGQELNCLACRPAD